MTSKFTKIKIKTLLSSDHWLYCIYRIIISHMLLGLGFIVRPINSDLSTIMKIYGYIFSFNPERLAETFNSNSRKFDTHLVVAARAFFEIAFTRGELLRICSFLRKTTELFPHLFVPWKLLHYVYYFLKSWQLLSKINCEYEIYREKKLESCGALGYDLIIGDQVTSSIGHSQIFFDFQILNSHYSLSTPKITICESGRDIMSNFYKEMIPDLFLTNISIEVELSDRTGSVNFIQDSFPFLFAKKYFNYSDERERTKYLGSWAATGAKAFSLGKYQKIVLEKFLKGIGLTENDWYVVLHVREGSDDSIRNADIESYYEAIEAIVANGGWVFRIGDNSMTPLRKGAYHVIDLPFSDITKPDYLDLYLLATARFVICTCSGPSDFPFYFNIPRLVTNWPCITALHGTSNDVCIPVSYKTKISNKVVTLREQLMSTDYDNEPKIRSLKNIVAIKNTANQIQQESIEMINRTSKHILRDTFPIPKSDSLYYKYRDKIWFMGSISKVFLNDFPCYLD